MHSNKNYCILRKFKWFQISLNSFNSKWIPNSFIEWIPFNLMLDFLPSCILFRIQVQEKMPYYYVNIRTVCIWFGVHVPENSKWLHEVWTIQTSCLFVKRSDYIDFCLLWYSQNKLYKLRPYLNLSRLLAWSNLKGPNSLPLLLPEQNDLSSRIAACGPLAEIRISLLVIRVLRSTSYLPESHGELRGKNAPALSHLDFLNLFPLSIQGTFIDQK